MATAQHPHVTKGSRQRGPQLLIGRDDRGNWVVRDEWGFFAQLFVSRVDALRFALFACGDRPQAAIMVPGVLER
jgi:hypothetical protein